MVINREQVEAALTRVVDPELQRDLMDLGMIREIFLSDTTTRITVALTIAGCPMKKRIQEDVEREVGLVSGVERVEVLMETMTDEEKKALSHKLGRTPKPLSVSPKTAIIGIASGKGGVGKSTVTANLAAALSEAGSRVGILDSDVWGFSIPRMLGISDRPRVVHGQIIPVEKHGLKLMSTGFFIEEDQPVIWRGPLVHRAIEQFLTEVAWGDLDYLLLDLPPGTGDVMLTTAKMAPALQVIMVTTPQPVAARVAVRAGHMAHRVNVPVIGVIENMSYAICDHCGKKNYFLGRGGADELAKSLGTKVIGRVPFEQVARESADVGLPVVLSAPSSLSAAAFREIAGKLKIVRAAV